MKKEKGSSLIEVVIALALLGLVGVSFLSALANTSRSRTISIEHSSARILAASQMEVILYQPYFSSYDPVYIPAEYAGYTTSVDVDNLFDGDLQKITISVWHNDKYITKLQTYKVIR